MGDIESPELSQEIIANPNSKKPENLLVEKKFAAILQLSLAVLMF